MRSICPSCVFGFGIVWAFLRTTSFGHTATHTIAKKVWSGTLRANTNNLANHCFLLGKFNAGVAASWWGPTLGAQVFPKHEVVG